MPYSLLIYLGDLRLTVALAGAVLVWLLAVRSYRSACLWCIAYGSAMCAVAASKIIYLAWGLQVPAIHFKAASGHAAGTAAVLPVVLYLLAMSIIRGEANIAFGAGWCVSAAVAFSLVTHGEHTPSEALVGWCLGMAASAITWRSMRLMVTLPSLKGIGAALAMMAVIANGMQAVPVSRWMTRTAMALSGQQWTHAWNDC